jgi:hypothetical protein
MEPRPFQERSQGAGDGLIIIGEQDYRSLIQHAGDLQSVRTGSRIEAVQ